MIRNIFTSMFTGNPQSPKNKKPATKLDIGKDIHSSFANFLQVVENNHTENQFSKLKKKWAAEKALREEQSTEVRFGYFNLGGEQLSVPEKFVGKFPNSVFWKAMQQKNQETDEEGYILIDCGRQIFQDVSDILFTYDKGIENIQNSHCKEDAARILDQLHQLGLYIKPEQSKKTGKQHKKYMKVKDGICKPEDKNGGIICTRSSLSKENPFKTIKIRITTTGKDVKFTIGMLPEYIAKKIPDQKLLQVNFQDYPCLQVDQASEKRIYQFHNIQGNYETQIQTDILKDIPQVENFHIQYNETMGKITIHSEDSHLRGVREILSTNNSKSALSFFIFLQGETISAEFMN